MEGFQSFQTCGIGNGNGYSREFHAAALGSAFFGCESKISSMETIAARMDQYSENKASQNTESG